MPAPRRCRTNGASRGLTGLTLALLLLAPSRAPAAGSHSKHAAETSASAERPDIATDPEATPIAGAFVYPVGDDLDYTKARSGEATGYHLSDPYMARRGSGHERLHLGVDLSNGHGGSPVRAVASGVVSVVDRNARIAVRTKETVKTSTVVHGKRVARTRTRYRTTYHWRTGWGNYVVIRHVLPSGASVYSLYGHLAPGSVTVKSGEIVVAGEPIARVGSTGRATSPHLHLEIRTSVALNGRDGNEAELDLAKDQPTPEERTFALLETVNPLDFLADHVERYQDLEPGAWETRYAMAAARDGIVSADGDHFKPDGPVRREDFYRTLVCAFRFAGAFPAKDWNASVGALVDAGILDKEVASEQKPGDDLTRSEALEILLRCLDQHRAYAWNLAELPGMQISRDFNQEFAGASAAKAAEKEAVAKAAADTQARTKAESERVAKARAKARAAGKKSTVKAKPVKPATPVPILDPGFESVANSKQELTRAESCLLLATSLRMGSERYSALQRAADRVAQSPSPLPSQ